MVLIVDAFVLTGRGVFVAFGRCALFDLAWVTRT